MSEPGPDQDDPRPWAADLLRFAEIALAEAEARAVAARAYADGIRAECRVRQAQIGCARCYGDTTGDVALFMATIGRGPCSCPVRCSRAACQGPGVLDDLDAL